MPALLESPITAGNQLNVNSKTNQQVRREKKKIRLGVLSSGHDRSLKITLVRDTFFLNVDLARWLFTLAIYNWNIRFLVSKCQKVLVDPRPNSD